MEAPPAAEGDGPTGQAGGPPEGEPNDGAYDDGQPEGEATLCAVFGDPGGIPWAMTET